MAVFETWLKSDLQKAVQVKSIQGNLFSADNAGNLIGVVITNGGSPAEITGNVTAYVIRADGATVVVEGSLSGNRASVTLPASAYAVVGQASIVIKVGTTTVGACTIYVYRSTTDTIVDPGEVIPSITELLEKIDEMEQGTAAANTAAQNANTAATSATTAASKIDNMTVEASRLPESASPTAQISEVSGHKHIAFGIPQGVTQTEFDDLSEQVINKAPAIECSASGSIASFPDGADGMPLKNLSVAIEPVQDLHGQDAPYPAGGGANIWDEDWELGTISADGTNYNSSTNIRSKNYIPVTEGETYYCKSPYANGIQIFEYDTNKAYLNRAFVTNATITLTANTKYIRLRTPDGVTTYGHDISINYPATDTAYHPYSNICPISGWTGAKVTRTGKNLVDVNSADNTGAYIDQFGNINSSNEWTTSGLVRVAGNTPYILSGLTSHPNTGNDNYRTYDKYKNYIGIVNVRIESYPVSFSSNVAYVQFCWKNTEKGTVLFEQSSTATSYEPYSGNTYDITFPSSAGTVYGGTLDVVTGVLTINGIVKVFDGNESFIGTYWPAVVCNTGLPYSGDYVHRSEMRCSHCETGSRGVDFASLSAITIQFGNVDEVFGVNNATEFASYIATQYANGTPVTVYYPLATPVTYQLTNQQVIETLKGVNNLWSSTGSVSIEYPADTRLFIEKRISELQALILENISNS